MWQINVLRFTFHNMLLMKLELRTITLIFYVLLMFLMFVKVYISMIKSGLLGFGLIVGVLFFFMGLSLLLLFIGLEMNF
jgi:hypothetical protein